MTPPVVDPEHARKFLALLWPQGTPEAGATLCYSALPPGGEIKTLWSLRDALAWAERANVWFGVATRRQANLPNNLRGGIDDCTWIPALWLDVDIGKPDSPATEADALELIDRFDLDPTVIVHSGHGFQPWWVFDKPLPAADAIDVLGRWHTTWVRLAAEMGVKLDNVSDIPRIMRLPGTINVKDPDNPKPVEVIDANGEVFPVEDIVALLDELPPPPVRVVHDNQGRTGDRNTPSDDDTPADWIRRGWDWYTELQDAGWTFHSNHGDETWWTRPGKATRDGHSAVLHGDGPLVVFSSSVDLKGLGRTSIGMAGTSLSPFDFYTLIHHNGDTRASGAAIRAQMPRREPPPPRRDDSAIMGWFHRQWNWARSLDAAGWTNGKPYDPDNYDGETFSRWCEPGKPLADGHPHAAVFKAVFVVYSPTFDCKGLGRGLTVNEQAWAEAGRPPGGTDGTVLSALEFYAISDHDGNLEAAKDAIRAARALEATDTGDDDDAVVDGTEDGGDVQGVGGDDTSNAEHLARIADGRIRFVHSWGKWVVYENGAWIVDLGNVRITELAKGVARYLHDVAAAMPPDPPDATVLADKPRARMFKKAERAYSAGAIQAMIHLARGIPELLIDFRDLDAHPELLNVANGTIDLRTGELRPHDPADLLMMQSPVPYDPNATASLWEACLATWQPDPEMREFLARVAGSGAVGYHLERLIVNIGTGGNGKSKFFGAIQRVLGPYSVVPDKSLFISSRHEPHPTVKATLFRTRLLVTPETEQGAHLAESSVKDLTGGDEIGGRRMHEDIWYFLPTWTAVMHTNHAPTVSGTDDGIWRRLCLVEWAAKIDPDQMDERLAEKLAAESSGILAWIVAGARDYLERGLAEPAKVITDTESYKVNEDHFGQFLAARCVEGKGYSFTVLSRDLRKAYEAWCEAQGETPLSAKRVGVELNGRGFRRLPTGEHRWNGLRLKTADEIASESV